MLSSPQILNVPLLLLANKQDSPDALSVEAIRETYEDWWQRRHQSGAWEHEEQPERVASLDVMGVSGLDGLAPPRSIRFHDLNRLQHQDRYQGSRRLVVHSGSKHSKQKMKIYYRAHCQ